MQYSKSFTTQSFFDFNNLGIEKKRYRIIIEETV